MSTVMFYKLSGTGMLTINILVANVTIQCDSRGRSWWLFCFEMKYRRLPCWSTFSTLLSLSYAGVLSLFALDASSKLYTDKVNKLNVTFSEGSTWRGVSCRVSIQLLSSGPPFIIGPPQFVHRRPNSRFPRLASCRLHASSLPGCYLRYAASLLSVATTEVSQTH